MVFLTRAVLEAGSRSLFGKSLKHFCYNTAGFYKYGLMRDDLRIETEEVQEALRRLPEHLRDERTFRITRAVVANANHTILPKEEWMTLEKDELYLTPYLNEVMEEIREKEEWNKE